MEDRLELHKSFAIKCFNQTWTLIEKVDRSPENIDRMINAAHASRYHWEIAGKAVNIARGEWLISRVYAILKRAEPCLYHADRCLKITLESNLQDFDLAFAYEAVARACKLAGDEVETAKYILKAKEAGVKIADKNDQVYFFSELEKIQPGSE
ncbi:MAG: hypothetical protein RQ728_05380 [Brevefilum sp.]|nr:hypothetical protein [Brevefilum sp.]MDW7754741.1 hypothetical protein [Brevefilum sp.]